jgi:uncharacterized protein (DUF58 family)
MFPFRSKRPDEALLRNDEIALRRRILFGQRVMRRMGLNRPLTDDEIHARMRPRARRFWISGTLILLLLSYWLQSVLLALCALLILSLGIVPEIWQRQVLRRVEFARGFSPARVSFGETTRYVVQVENRKRLPVPWLEIEDEFALALDMPGAPIYPSYKADRQLFITAFSLWGNQRVTRRYRVIPLARGVWNFGPTYLRAGDPFGFLDDERKVTQRGGQHSLTVLPLVVPLTRFGLPSRYPFGEIETRRHVLEDTSQIIGARDYQPGDPLRRVHWKATAHQGALQSKVHPYTTAHTLAIFMDIYTLPNPALGINTALFELGITAAASIATWANRQRYAVGLISNGLPQTGGAHEMTSFADAQAFMRVPPSTHPNHLVRLLEALARLQPYFGVPIDRMLAREQASLPPGATIILITAAAALQPATVARLERLRRRGYAVAIVLTGDEPVATGALLAYRIGGEDTWHEFVAFATQQRERRADTSDSAWTTRDPAGSTPDGAGSSSTDTPDQHHRQPAITVG